MVDQRGHMHGYHPAETAPAASVFKVMLLAALLRKRHDSGLSVRDRKLLGPMIRRSDSVAATAVRNMVGRGRIERLARVAGMRDFHYEWVWGESRTSPRDQAVFTQFDPDHAYGKRVLRGVFARLLRGLGRYR